MINIPWLSHLHRIALSYNTFIYKAGEPISTRLASLAMDIDDIDYAYHIAYPEIIWGIFRVRIMARYHESDLEIKPYRKSV